MNEIMDFLGSIDALEPEGQAGLDKLIDSTSDLKQLPIVARKIMKVVEDPRSTAGTLERVIQADQAMTSKLLKIANSSFYGLLRKVNTLQRAILVVGFKAIKDIAISTAILNLYRSSDPISIKYWEHGIGVGIAARMISLEFDKTETEEAFIGGLLHNLGKTLILRAKPELAKQVYHEIGNDSDFDELAMEKELLGFTHTHAGGQLARNWNLAPSLEAMMRYHHHMREVLWADVDEAFRTNIAIIALADRLCRKKGIGFEKPCAEIDMMDCPEQEFLKIPADRIEQIGEELKLAFFAESQLFT